VLAHVAERAPEGVVVDRRVLYGPSAHSILDAALEGGCDLLVAGSRAYGPLRRVLAGSVSSHLLTDGRVPVLVTPRGTGEPAVAEAAPEAETVS
jgi:nucleotide-binding universal stress UspA family protein